VNIMHALKVAASPDRLYRAVTTQDGIAGWYTPETRAETRVGGVIECTFGSYGSLEFQVDELDPARRVTWTVVQGPPEWRGTKLTFDIAEDDGEVEFDFCHAGLPEGYDAFSSFNYLWGQYMRSIKLFAETGVGEPFGSPGSKAARTTP
jgi:uncharacterized protein YndB with AHSA1/START domain